MSTKIPVSKHAGPLRIGSWQFHCYVLDDERRVVAMMDFMEIMGVKANERHNFIKYLVGLKDHPLTSSAAGARMISRILEPILFQSGNNLNKGYEGELFVEFCKYLLSLRKLGLAVSLEEKSRCDIAEAIIVSLAGVGIVALIDEAAGYQTARPRDALQALLDRYLLKELAAWAKRFPDEFYMELFRLKGWEWKGMKVNRPQVVGYYTRDLVYERLAPGIVEELESRLPTDDQGRRAAKFHQFLTEDVGHPALAQHLHAVIGLMRASNSWSTFRHLIDRAFPRRGDTFELNLDLDD